MAQQHLEPTHPTAAAGSVPADALAGYLRAQATEFLRALRLHRETGANGTEGSGDAARALRRAARRISGSLHTFQPLLDSDWAESMRPELAWLSGTLALEHAYASRLERLLQALHRLSGPAAFPAQSRGARVTDPPGPAAADRGHLTVGAAKAGALLDRQLTLARTRAHSTALQALGSSRFHAVADKASPSSPATGSTSRASPGRPRAASPRRARSGLAQQVTQTSGAISYFELSYAKDGIKTVDIKTEAAEPVKATVENATAAIGAAKVIGTGKDLALELDYTPSAAGAYPITLVTYEIVCDKGNKAETLPATKSFLNYIASESGQGLLADAGYAPMPDEIITKVRDTISALS
ncbi:hypothetical protein SFUMM280S_10111 [Streptomyces fumanus]